MRQYQNNRGKNFITACSYRLVKIPIFSQISEVERKRIASIIDKRFFFMGNYIFKPGDSGRQLFIVHTGLVKITQPVHNKTELSPVMKKDGHFFGQVSFLDCQKHYSTAICATDSVIYTINRSDFDELASKNPVIGVKILTSIYNSLFSKLKKTSSLYHRLILL